MKLVLFCSCFLHLKSKFHTVCLTCILSVRNLIKYPNLSLIPFYMLKVFDVRPLLSQKWSVDKIHEAWRLWFIHMKEEIDFPFSSESVTKKLFSVFWLLTLLPFMAFFLLIIHWVIMYSCKMQNQLTCNQVWTQEMLVLSISGLTVSYLRTHGTVVYSLFC